MSKKNHVSFSFLKKIPVTKLFKSLRSKLIFSFSIPIIFLVLLGFFSVQMVSNGFEEKYKDSASQIVGRTAEYLDLGLKTVENTSVEYINDKNLSNYFVYSQMKSKTNEIYQLSNTIKNDCLVKTTVDDFILNI